MELDGVTLGLIITGVAVITLLVIVLASRDQATVRIKRDGSSEGKGVQN